MHILKLRTFIFQISTIQDDINLLRPSDTSLNYAIIASDDNIMPVRRQAAISINAGLVLIGHLGAFGIYFSNISTVTIDLSKAVDSLPFALSVAQLYVRRGILQESLTGPLLFDTDINQ